MTKPRTPRMRMPRVEPLWTVAAAAEMLGLSPRQTWNLLRGHPERFVTRRYDRDGPHPRRVRLLNTRDIEELGRLRIARVRVKKIRPLA